MASLHFVEEQKQVAIVAQLAQAAQVFGGSHGDAALSLDRFHQDGGRLGRDRLAHGLEIVERDVLESGHHRLKAFLHLFLPGSGNPRERAPVEGIEGGDDFEPAFVVPEFSRQLEESFVGFRSAVAKKAAPGPDQFDQLLSEPPLRLIIIEIGNVQELTGLLDERGGDLGVGMPKGADGDAAAKVEVALPVDVPDVTPLAALQHEIEARVGGNDELFKNVANLLLAWALSACRWTAPNPFGVRR